MMMPETLEMEALPPAVVAEILQKVEKKKSFWQKHHGLLKQVVIRKKKERNVCNELQVSCPPQILCIFSLNLCQLNIGFGLGFSAVALPQIKEEFSIELSTWSQGAFGKVTVGKNRL